MSSFSLVFPDDLVFGVLGDDVVARLPDGSEHPHKCEFSKTYENEELADRISDEFPWLEIQPKFSHLYVDGTKVLFNDSVYSYEAKHHKDANTVMVVLREELREEW